MQTLEQLEALAAHVHAGRAPVDVLESAIAEHVSREAMRQEAIEHAAALVDALNETPGAPGAPRANLWTKAGVRVYLGGDSGYVTVGHDGSISGASAVPGRRRQSLTFSPDALYPAQRRAYAQALDRYRAGIVDRAAEHAQERMARIDELRVAFGLAPFAEEDEEALERAAGRAAYQEAHEEGRGNPDQVVEAYHGGSAPIRKFDPSKVVDNSFWFSEDKDKILRGESGAASVKWLMTVRLRVSKTAGWDEYDRYFLTQLQDMGYDSVHLDDDWIIFDPERIEVVRVERVTARKNPRAMRRAADPGDWVEIEDAAYDDEVDDWVTIEECACSSCAPMRLNPPKRKATGAYADLDSIVPVIAEALAKHGLTMAGIEEVKFTRGGKSRAGSCAYSRTLNKCQILFNGLAWPAFTEESRFNTVMHEAAHAIQFLTTGNSDHGPVWQRIAKSIGCSGDRCMTAEASQAMHDAYSEAKGLPKRKIVTRESAMEASADFNVGDYVSFDHKRERWYGKITGKDAAHARVMVQQPATRVGITGKIPYPLLQKEAKPMHAEKVAGVDKPAPGESVAAWQARTGRAPPPPPRVIEPPPPPPAPVPRSTSGVPENLDLFGGFGTPAPARKSRKARNNPEENDVPEWDEEYGTIPHYARNFKRVRVPVSQIASPFVNPVKQERIDELAALEDAGYTLPPIIVDGPGEVEEEDYPEEKYPFLDGHYPVVGEDVWYVHDGHHRTMLAIQRGDRFIDALVME